MYKIAFLITAVAFALPAHATTLSTTSQEVRFAQQTAPNGVVVPPRVVSAPSALYTDEARQNGIEGTVVVQAQFDEQGTFTVLKVAKGLGYGLDENALAALSNWRFSPALRNGLPVTAIAEIEVPFRLGQSYGEYRYSFSYEYSFGGGQ